MFYANSLRLIRYLSNLPAIFLLENRFFYSIIKFMDYKNYEVFWEDQLQIKMTKKREKNLSR